MSKGIYHGPRDGGIMLREGERELERVREVELRTVLYWRNESRGMLRENGGGLDS